MLLWLTSPYTACTICQTFVSRNMLFFLFTHKDEKEVLGKNVECFTEILENLLKKQKSHLNCAVQQKRSYHWIEKKFRRFLKRSIKYTIKLIFFIFIILKSIPATSKIWIGKWLRQHKSTFVAQPHKVTGSKVLLNWKKVVNIIYYYSYKIVLKLAKWK